MFEKLGKATIGFVLSVSVFVCPDATTRLSLDGFSWNSTFVYFSKIYPEISSFVEISQE